MATQLPADIDFVAQPAASPARMNAAMGHLNGRLNALETPKASYDAKLADLQSIGLARIANALVPVYNALTAVAQLGAIFTAPSASAATFSAGTKVFVIGPDKAGVYAAAAYVAAISTADPTQIISGRLQSYDSTTGTLTLLCDTFTGPAGGSNAGWTLTPAPDAAVLRTYTDSKITALIDTADAAGNTLGKLQASINANAAAIPVAQAAATANALALAIALG